MAAVVGLCCETVEATRPKGTPERREVWGLRRKVEENSLMVLTESPFLGIIWEQEGMDQKFVYVRGYVEVKGGAMHCLSVSDNRSVVWRS